MNWYYVMVGVVIVAVFMLVAGCTPNRPYRTSAEAFTGSAADAGTNARNNAIIEKTKDYSLGFVEFDEEGWFWNTGQKDKVEAMINEQANTGGANNPAGIVLLVFVHGWKNNAAYNCGNVETFRTVLQELSAAETARSAEDNQPARKIVGVYCGWRGLSATWEPFKELTFWNRKATAHKVGGYSAMTQLFVELEELQEHSNRTLKSNAPRTELIIVGHSFGAAAVYSAISEFITERFVENVEQNRPLKPLGDQVILLNPAFEASRHYNLNRLATSIKEYPAAQRPVLSIFTSEGDWATHYALPAGRFLATMFEKFRDAEQRRATRDAIGWFEPFVTHSLDFNTNAIFGGTAPTTTINPRTKQSELDRTNITRLRESYRNIREQRAKWVPNNSSPQTYYFDDCILKPRGTFKPGDPFLVVAVDKKIMKNHDDIANTVLLNFLREYIQFCHSGNTNTGSSR